MLFTQLQCHYVTQMHVHNNIHMIRCNNIPTLGKLQCKNFNHWLLFLRTTTDKMQDFFITFLHQYPILDFSVGMCGIDVFISVWFLEKLGFGSEWKHLAKEMISVMVEEDEMFISHDVVSLFTNTPIHLALQVIRERLEGDTQLHKRTRLTVENRLIEVHSDNHVLLFLGRHIPTDVRCHYGEPSFPASSQSVYGMDGEAGYCHGTGWI